MDAAAFGIGHIVIPVHDMKLAIQFYRDTLGLPLIGIENPVWNVVNAGGTELTLFLQPDSPRIALGKDGDDSPFIFHVSDFQSAATFLEEHGVKLKRIDERQGVVSDPSGNVFGIHDHKKKD